MFPLKIVNGKGVSLLDRFKQTNAKAFRATCVSEYPNLVSSLFHEMGGFRTTDGLRFIVYAHGCQFGNCASFVLLDL